MDQPSTSDDQSEPPRPRTIPDDFVWVPEKQAWFAPGEGDDFLRDYWPGILKATEENYEDDDSEGPHLLAIDELRAPGTHDRPRKSRKSRRVASEQLPLFADDDPPSESES